ncbi:MAG TPA: hypothetical protein VI136_27290 [Verrucomicrobiae bacterium]
MPLENETNSNLVFSNVLTSHSVWVTVSNVHGIAHSASARLEVRTNLASLNWPAQPLGASGWNADVVVENRPVPTLTPGGFDGVDRAWKEVGFMADYPAFFNHGGLPSDGCIHSLADTNVVFQLQPYASNNALLLSTANGWTRDLILTPPVRLHSLAVLGAASNPQNSIASSAVKLIFTDSTSTSNLNLAFPDWWDGASVGRLVRRPAIAALGRVYRNGYSYRSDWEYYDMTGFSLHHADIDIGAMGLTNKFIDRLRFSGTAISSVGILAISGSVLETMPPPVLAITLNPSVPDVSLNWSSLTTNCVLKQASSLEAGALWSTVTNKPVVRQGTNYSITLPLGPAERFFRVSLP